MKFSEAATLRLFKNDTLLTQIREESKSERDSAPSLNSRLSNGKSARSPLKLLAFKFSHAKNDDEAGRGAELIALHKKNDDIVSDQGFWMNPSINKNNSQKPLEHQIKDLKTEMRGTISKKMASRQNSDIETNLTSEQ